MKKLMIAAAIAMVASVSQAFSVTWGAINVKTPIAADVTVDQTGITGSGTAMTGLIINLAWVDKSGNDVSLGTFTTNGGKIGTVTLSDDVASAMLANQGESWKPTFHMTATYSTADGVYTFDGTASSGKALSQLSTANVGTTANFGSMANWSYTANAVPEPTSGLLLLLGVAGLALKRKRA